MIDDVTCAAVHGHYFTSDVCKKHREIPLLLYTGTAVTT